MDAFWQEVWRRVDPHVGRILGAMVILLVGVLALRYLTTPFRRLLERSRLEPSLVSFLANTVWGLLLVVIAIGILQQLGVETASLLTVLAAAGLAIALSLQNTLANFTAGLLLLSFRMLRVGDVLEVGAVRGRVTDIFPFYVVLLTEDNQTVTLPHTLLTSNGFRNQSVPSSRRVQWSLSVRAGDDLSAAKEALHNRLLADPRIQKEPPPRLFVQEWSDDKRVLAVQAWTTAREAQAVQEELLEALGLALESQRANRGGPD
jgi:small conductance mechanosensitive channel